MLLEEFREALSALPSYATVVWDQSGARVEIEAVDYDRGVIRVSVDDVMLVGDSLWCVLFFVLLWTPLVGWIPPPSRGEAMAIIIARPKEDV
jgi:hypothetical protein